MRDITQRQATELALKASRRQLRDLSEHLQTILEKEKKEISRRIHDDLGQQLTALKMDVFWLNQRLSPDQPALSEKIKSITRLIDGTYPDRSKNFQGTAPTPAGTPGLDRYPGMAA